MRPPCWAHPPPLSPAKRQMSLDPERVPAEGELPGLEEKGTHTAAVPSRRPRGAAPRPPHWAAWLSEADTSSPAFLPSKQTQG